MFFSLVERLLCVFFSCREILVALYSMLLLYDKFGFGWCSKERKKVNKAKWLWTQHY